MCRRHGSACTNCGMAPLPRGGAGKPGRSGSARPGAGTIGLNRAAGNVAAPQARLLQLAQRAALRNDGRLSILVAFMGGCSFLSPCVLPLFLCTFPSSPTIRAPVGRRRRPAPPVDPGQLLASWWASMVFVGMGASFSALGQFLFDYARTPRRRASSSSWAYAGASLDFPPLPAVIRSGGLVGRGWWASPAIGWVRWPDPRIHPLLAARDGVDGVALLVAYSAGLALPFVPRRSPSARPAYGRFRPWIPSSSGCPASCCRRGRAGRHQLLHRAQLVRAESHAAVVLKRL